MRITVVGAGNVGTQLAVHCAERGHAVTVYGSRPDQISKTLFILDENGRELHRGEIERATADPALAFADAEMILVTVPAFCMKQTAERIEPFAADGLLIGLIPGTGGGECAFSGCLDRGATVFGLQRVPSVARLARYGSAVTAVGYRAELAAAALPSSQTALCCRLLADLIGIPCAPLPDYLNLTLTPSNPILHTTRLRMLFRDYAPGVVYPRIPLFYEEWDDDTSRLLFLCDEELQKICRALPDFDLAATRSLRIHYESDTPEKLTAKIRSIRGFRGLPSPMLPTEGGFVPDFDSRYFTADFPFGLSILKQIADLLQISVPHITETLLWYRKVVGEGREFDFSDYGIRSIAALYAFYKR